MDCSSFYFNVFFLVLRNFSNLLEERLSFNVYFDKNPYLLNLFFEYENFIYLVGKDVSNTIAWKSYLYQRFFDSYAVVSLRDFRCSIQISFGGDEINNIQFKTGKYSLVYSSLKDPLFIAEHSYLEYEESLDKIPYSNTVYKDRLIKFNEIIPLKELIFNLRFKIETIFTKVLKSVYYLYEFEEESEVKDNINQMIFVFDSGDYFVLSANIMNGEIDIDESCLFDEYIPDLIFKKKTGYYYYLLKNVSYFKLWKGCVGESLKDFYVLIDDRMFINSIQLEFSNNLNLIQIHADRLNMFLTSQSPILSEELHN